MGLLDQGYKDEMNNAMGQIFDTFANATPFRFYKPSIEEVIIYDSEFNADLSEYNNPNATLTENYAEFRCRVIYPRRENTMDNFVAGGSNIQVKGETLLGIVYLQFQDDALAYIGDAIRFTFMGENYQKLTAVRRIGIIDTWNVYQITLRQVN